MPPPPPFGWSRSPAARRRNSPAPSPPSLEAKPNGFTVDHVTFVSDRSFDAVVAGFHEQVGSLEETGGMRFPAEASDQIDFERRVKDVLGPSGFTRFLTINHGEWVTKQGGARRASCSARSATR